MPSRKRLRHGLLLGAAGSLVSLALTAGGLLTRLENIAWDARARWLAQPARTTESVRLIFLDQYSLDWASEQLGLSWPWPREAYAAITAFCRRGGARTVVFDVMFTEPSSYGVADDEALSKAIENGVPFVGAVFLGHHTGRHTAIPDAAQSALPLTAPPTGLEVFSRAAMPISEISAAATLLGNVSAQPDADGVFRRLHPGGIFDRRFVPSLGLAAYLAATDQKIQPVHQPRTLKIDRLAIPLDRQGRALLRYRGPSQTHPTVNAAAVINSELRLREGLVPEIDPAVFKDTWVFLGFTAPGLFDLKSAPVASVYPGVEIHATMLDNLLAGDFIRPFPATAAAALILILAVLAGILARHCGAPLPGSALLAGGLLLPMLLGLAAYAQGFDFPVTALQTALGLAIGGGLLVNYAIEGHQRRFLKSAFKQYLSREVIDQLVEHPEQLQLGGEERELTLFFSDIRGFTTLSENLSPSVLTAMLNDYLTAMCDVIMQTGGTIDKFEGDAVIAFWNAPLEQPDHAVRAVDAALRCQQRLDEMQPQFQHRTAKELFTRIGLHSGPVVVGNLGSNQRFNYTFLGDAGNLASRIEGVNKVFGTRILLTAQTADLLGGRFELREIANIRVVGRVTPVTVFEPLPPPPNGLQPQDIEHFAQALACWKQGDLESAGGLFERLAGRDPVAAAYLERCRQLNVRREPPLSDWDGVWNLTEK